MGTVYSRWELRWGSKAAGTRSSSPNKSERLRFAKYLFKYQR